MSLTCIYISSIIIAFGCSLVKFKLHPKHLKLLSLIVGLDLIGEFAGRYLYKLIQNNLPSYNVVLLIEFVGFACFFNLIAKSKWLKTITRFYTFLFPIFWFISVFILFGKNSWNGLLKWNSYVYIIGSLFTIIFAVIFYYELVKNADINSFAYNSEFWVATGLIIFFAANLPYMGMFYFLTVNYPDLANSFGTLLLMLNIVMYSMFAYAYLCRRIPFMKLKQ